MKRLTGILILLLAAGLASDAAGEPVVFAVDMDGSQEVCGPGDPDGAGKAYLAIDLEEMAIDWHIQVDEVEFPLTGAHIHRGMIGKPGPVVVDFGDQLNGAGLTDPDLAAIVASPAGYYINVHNPVFSAGAVRGQLGAPVPEPATISLLAIGLAGLGLSRRRMTQRRGASG